LFASGIYIKKKEIMLIVAKYQIDISRSLGLIQMRNKTMQFFIKIPISRYTGCIKKRNLGTSQEIDIVLRTKYLGAWEFKIAQLSKLLHMHASA
jgi:hypothetical protein